MGDDEFQPNTAFRHSGVPQDQSAEASAGYEYGRLSGRFRVRRARVPDYIAAHKRTFRGEVGNGAAGGVVAVRDCRRRHRANPWRWRAPGSIGGGAEGYTERSVRHHSRVGAPRIRPRGFRTPRTLRNDDRRRPQRVYYVWSDRIALAPVGRSGSGVTGRPSLHG